MACPDCENKNVDCGCTEGALNINTVCNPVVCEADECSESFAAKCILYTGDPITCNNVNVIETGTNVAQALANVAAFFCTQNTVDADVTCGEDTIVTAGATVNDALDQIVAYFCTAINTLTDAVFTSANIGVVNTPDPEEPLCTDSLWTITFLDSTGATIDTVQFTTRTCEPAITGLAAGNNRSAQIQNTIVEGTLIPTVEGTLSVGANEFNVGDTFIVKARGNINVTGTPDLTLRIKINGAAAVTHVVSMKAATSKNWDMEILFTVRTLGATAILAIGGEFSYGEDASSKHDTEHIVTVIGSLDTTIANTLDLTAEWSVADVSNSIDTELFVLHKMY